MDQKNKILLSICIPTFNRAELLRSALYNLVPQIKKFQDEVELIVSDNNSPDNTEEVVKWAQQFGPIHYHCNAENIGANSNFLFAATQLAEGEFCWILGDDDFVRPDAVKKILGIIKDYPDIEYIYVNIAHFSTDLLKIYSKPVSSADIPDNLPLGNKDPREYFVERWDTLINPDISAVFFGAIQVSVVRRSVWCKYADSLNISEPFSSLDSTYPHIVIFGKGLVGKKAYYIGQPFVIVVDGARECLEYVPKICLVYLHEALDSYEMRGVDSKQIEKCRKFLVKNNSGFVTRILKYDDIKDVQYNFAIQYVLKYWKYLSLPCLILNAPTLIQLFIKKRNEKL